MNVMENVTNDFGMPPYEINNGKCEEWAYSIMEKLPNVEIWETLFDFADIQHIFIRINNKFYDAQCLYGVEDHMQLPIFKNLRRQPVWIIDTNCK